MKRFHGLVQNIWEGRIYVFNVKDLPIGDVLLTELPIAAALSGGVEYVALYRELIRVTTCDFRAVSVIWAGNLRSAMWTATDTRNSSHRCRWHSTKLDRLLHTATLAPAFSHGPLTANRSVSFRTLARN